MRRLVLRGWVHPDGVHGPIAAIASIRRSTTLSLTEAHRVVNELVAQGRRAVLVPRDGVSSIAAIVPEPPTLHVLDGVEIEALLAELRACGLVAELRSEAT